MLTNWSTQGEHYEAGDRPGIAIDEILFVYLIAHGDERQIQVYYLSSWNSLFRDINGRGLLRETFPSAAVMAIGY
jgi:hypothetical protein